MQEREVVTSFASGKLASSMLQWDQARSGWIVLLQTTRGETIALENKRGRSIRLFKTSDAALRWCQRIGFREISINL